MGKPQSSEFPGGSVVFFTEEDEVAILQFGRNCSFMFRGESLTTDAELYLAFRRWVSGVSLKCVGGVDGARRKCGECIEWTECENHGIEGDYCRIGDRVVHAASVACVQIGYGA